MGLGRCVVTHIICTIMKKKKFHALWSLTKSKGGKENTFKILLMFLLCLFEEKFLQLIPTSWVCGMGLQSRLTWHDDRVMFR